MSSTLFANVLILTMKMKGEEMKRERLRTIFFRNFIGGIATGLGLTVGISLVAYLLGLLVSTFGGLPVIGFALNSILEALKSK
mgnify:FL=1